MLGLNYDFIFPKIHGIWADSFSVERINYLAVGQDLSALSRALLAIGIDIKDRREVQKALFSKLIQQLYQIQRLLDEPLGKFYSGQIQRFYFENIKTILHYRYQRTETAGLERVLIHGPGLPELPLEGLLEAKSVHQFYQTLPEHPCKEKMLPILVELDDSKDMLAAECKIDELYYGWLTGMAFGLPRIHSKTAAEIVGMEIDSLNIITCLRNIAVYEIAPARIRKLLIEQRGQLSSSTLDKIASATDSAELVTKLPAPYRQTLRRHANDRLYVRENALWSLIYHKCYRYFRDFNRPPLSVLAFPFLKRFEYLNLSRLFEGLYLGLAPGVIRSMIIGGENV